MKLQNIQILLLLLLGSLQLFAQEGTKDIEKNREVNYFLIEASSALTQGNAQKAISLYNECLAINKNCATAHYELANIAIAVQDMDVALEHSRAAVAIAPQNGWYQLQLAGILERKGMLQQAAAAYTDLAKLETQNPYYLQKSLMLYETSEAWDKALQVCTLIEQQQGADFNMLARKQTLYAKAGRKKDGYKELRALLKKDPDNSEYYSLLAMYYEVNGDKKKAAKTYNKIAALNEKSGVAEIILTRHYMSTKQYPKAFEALKTSIQSGEVGEKANIAAVIDLLQADTAAQAKVRRDTLASLLIAQYPENAIGYLFKAQQYGDNNENEKRGEVLSKALEIDPSNYNGLAQLCVLQNIEKQWNALYETAKKGISYYPQEHLFYIFKGLAATQKKEYMVAESSLEAGYLYAKDTVAKDDIKELLADVYYKSGKIQKAFDLFEEILSKSPDNQMILNNYAYFLSLEQQQLEKAEKMSRKTIEAEPENATYLDTYAWILYQQENYAEAFKYVEKAIAALKDNEASSEMWEHYGDILFQIGKKQQAMVEWQKALTLPEPETERLQKKIEENK